ncbi:unnamed protein product [Candidula unifasciata]|uniref:Uncharacterized protein n=1 Tax=Candidula unifasciata TaxID=100452 RepID=A0A8S3ZXM3_9EUPU|nr:unnamed protein product [Candidula unifasciata]
MKCNLTRLVRCIIVVVITILFINVAVFLNSAQGPLSRGIEEGFLPVLRRLGGGDSHRTYESTTTAPLRLNSSTTCPGLQMLELPRAGVFQEVIGRSMYVYSAFLDQGAVRMVGLMEENVVVTPLTCQLWFNVKGRDPLVLTPATWESMPENHGRRYTAVMIHCPISCSTTTLRVPMLTRF